MPASDTREISLLQMLGAEPLDAQVGETADVILKVPDAYLTDQRLRDSASEVLAIQRLLTLAQRRRLVAVEWEPAVARRVLGSPAVHPLASVTLCLSDVEQRLPLDPLREQRLTIEGARTTLLKHRLQADMFTESQVLVCVDHQRPSLPRDLYNQDDGRLLGEENFESFIDDLLTSQHFGSLDRLAVSKRRLPTAVMIRELIENTDDHAKTDASGNSLKPNSLRGLVIKRVLQERRLPGREVGAHGEPLPCLELSIFDSGIGYYDSYRRQYLRGQARGAAVSIGTTYADILKRHALGPDVPLGIEHAILLKCLERHSGAAIPDPRPGHRGMGLYEVLRALKAMGGLFEVRTGRLHGYRSFLQGEWRILLEPETSPSRPGMPKPSLLDMTRRMLPLPTEHEQLVGAVVRIVIPLV